MRPTATGRDGRLLYAWGMALLLVAIASGLVLPLTALMRLVPLDPNEGWNAFFGHLAVTGGPLYPAPGRLIINNYPPVSFYVVGALGRVVGDDILAGRWVALASMIAVVVNVHLWLRAVGAQWRSAALGAALTATLAVTYARPYAAINDPQWLGHALMTTGLVVLARGQASTRAIVAGSLLMVVAGFTKHLLIPIPIATTWWLLGRSRTAGLTWLAAGALWLALGVLCVAGLYGADFFDSLRSAREYSVHQAVKDTRRALKCFAPVLAVAAWLPFAARDGDRIGGASGGPAAGRTGFALAYLLSAAVIAVAAAGGIGVDINAFFDLMIAACLAAALTVDACWSRALPARVGRLSVGGVLTLALGAALGLYAASLVPGEWRERRGLDALERDTRAGVQLIAAAGRGHAACETPELCYWAKDDFNLDFFNYGQRLAVGRQPLTPCETAFDGRTLTLLQLDPNTGGGSPQLPPACNDVIRRHYRVVQSSSLGVVMAARQPP